MLVHPLWSSLLWFVVIIINPMNGDAAPCRDRFLEPFSSQSIWNTAIGSNAVMVPAHLYPEGRLPTQFHNDQAPSLTVRPDLSP